MVTAILFYFECDYTYE